MPRRWTSTWPTSLAAPARPRGQLLGGFNISLPALAAQPGAGTGPSRCVGSQAANAGHCPLWDWLPPPPRPRTACWPPGDAQPVPDRVMSGATGSGRPSRAWPKAWRRPPQARLKQYLQLLSARRPSVVRAFHQEHTPAPASCSCSVRCSRGCLPAPPTPPCKQRCRPWASTPSARKPPLATSCPHTA